MMMFPRSWALEKEGKKGDIADPFLSSSRRLMRLAARRYGVELRPVSPLGDGKEGEGAFSLAIAYGFADLDRVLSIEAPGLLLDATPMDAVLAFTKPAPFAMLQGSERRDGVHSTDLLLLQPSALSTTELNAKLASNSGFGDSQLPTTFSNSVLIAATTEDHTLVRSIGALHDAEHGFNATAYLSDISYIRFSDPKLPGPEYDVPWPQKVAARPKNKDADWTWTKLYGQFAQRRMEVCGLDLETYRAE
ncbi:glycosyltransferase family 8 protein [Baudoinia panamericana UAMH 10762]|uniref:Glycosyltransferase family 8 protein n=1 Tax=Baudoinia panamericana (strain UAMH 10762) TaxID=717646 RepID=M2LVP4_BAUPA|nr:glycosyltransferase family 8 protein [Baudoinia panamericana UAMH 10762]EMC98727.1 glycosyltransferase family 8 protein [Baudoinia panamericana UAMH 10762]